MISEPTTPSAAMASIRTMATRIDDRKCHSPSSARSTRSITDGAGRRGGRGASRRKRPGVDLFGHVRLPPQRPKGDPRVASRPSMLVSISTPTVTSRTPVTMETAWWWRPTTGQPPGDPGRAQRHREERDREAGRVGDQEDRPLEDARGRRGQAEDPAEDRADAGAPARREQQAEQEGAGIAGPGVPAARGGFAAPGHPARRRQPPAITSPPPIDGIARVSRHRARTLITPATWRPRKTRSAPPTMFMHAPVDEGTRARRSPRRRRRTRARSPSTNESPWRKAGRRPVVPSPVAPIM